MAGRGDSSDTEDTLPEQVLCHRGVRAELPAVHLAGGPAHDVLVHAVLHLQHAHGARPVPLRQPLQQAERQPRRRRPAGRAGQERGWPAAPRGEPSFGGRPASPRCSRSPGSASPACSIRCSHPHLLSEGAQDLCLGKQLPTKNPLTRSLIPSPPVAPLLVPGSGHSKRLVRELRARPQRRSARCQHGQTWLVLQPDAARALSFLPGHPAQPEALMHLSTYCFITH